MRQILFLAVAALVAGGYLARYADQTVVEPMPQAATVQPVEQPMQSSAGQHRMELSSGRDGHFHVDARIDGRHVDFLVDTGASLVVLRETDAADDRHPPDARDYTAVVSTANGKIKAAPRQARPHRDRRHHGLSTCRRWCCRTRRCRRTCSAWPFCRGCERYEVADGRLVLEQ